MQNTDDFLFKKKSKDIFSLSAFLFLELLLTMETLYWNNFWKNHRYFFHLYNCNILEKNIEFYGGR